MKKNKKQKSRRSRQKYPALNPLYNLKTRAELIDYDYLDKLSDKEKEWLNKFTEEYVNANLDRKNPRRNLHKKKHLRSDCDRRNNARNKDIWTMAKAQGKALNIDKAFNSEEEMNAALEEMQDLGSQGNYRSERRNKTKK